MSILLSTANKRFQSDGVRAVEFLRKDKPDLSCQSKFIPIDFAQQIIPGTFEYALSHIVDEHLDLSAFDKWYDNDKGGAGA